MNTPQEQAQQPIKAYCRECKAEHQLEDETAWGPCPDCGSPHTWWKHDQADAHRDLVKQARPEFLAALNEAIADAKRRR